jgi:hypothetical protein
MNPLQDKASQVSQAIAFKKDALIQEALEKYYSFRVSRMYAIYLSQTAKLNISVVSGVETYYIENTPILEIYPTEMIDTDEPGVISFDFKYRSLI